jgi:glycine cleavage system H protein
LRYLAVSGHGDLPYEATTSPLAIAAHRAGEAGAGKNEANNMVALLVLMTILIFLTVDLFLQRAEMRRESPVLAASSGTVRVSPAGQFPAQGFWLDDSHCWLRQEKDGAVQVGADWLPTAMLGHPESIEEAPPGTRVWRGDPVVTVKGEGRHLVLRAPLDGTILSVNPETETDPRVIEHDPFGRGWLYRMQPVSAGPIQKMRTGKDAVAWMKSELARLRASVLNLLPSDDPVGVTLQDGGFPVRGMARLVDDEHWKKLTDDFFAPPSRATKNPAWLAEALSSSRD